MECEAFGAFMFLITIQAFEQEVADLQGDKEDNSCPFISFSLSLMAMKFAPVITGVCVLG